MKDRVIFLDYLRFIACFMVMLVHSCEPFYLGHQGTYIANAGDAFWVTAIDSALRPCIPLFVLASSYLLFPLRTSPKQFFRRRFVRVVIPFAFWLLLYTFIPLYGSMYGFYNNDSLLTNFLNVLFNFPGPAGHLWFVYMLLGVYLMIPLLSPWIERVSRRGEEAFLALWLFTTLVPFLRQLANHIYGLPQILGEANWNEFGTLYGVSGFVGVLILGHYFRTYLRDLSWGKTLLYALPLWAAGYAITSTWFWTHIPTTYPVDAPVDLAVTMEVGWGFTSTGVIQQAIGYFLLIQKITASGWLYRHMVLPVSKASYGMYLMHIFFLSFFVVVMREHISITPLCMLSIALCSYLTSFVVSWVLGRIPVIGKYLVG